MEAIAREAGVDKRLILYYFQTKAGLLDALIDWYLGGEVDEMRPFYADAVEENGDRQAVVARGHQDTLDGPDARRAYLIYLDIAVYLFRKPDEERGWRRSTAHDSPMTVSGEGDNGRQSASENLGRVGGGALI